MWELITGTFISIKIEKLLILYFENINFYYDFIFFSNKNLFYISLIEATLGWVLYEQIFVDEFLILKTIKLTLSYELFADDFIIIFENVKLQNRKECWQYINKIYRTHGKRFMLFKNYRNKFITNILQVSMINIILTFSILIVEIFVIIFLLYCLNYLIKIETSKRLKIKCNEYINYLKGLSSDHLAKKKIKYTLKNYLFLFFLSFFVFKYINIYCFFDLSIIFILFHFITTLFFYYFYKFFIWYNFYFSFICTFMFNKFFKKIRLSIKVFIIKFSTYFFILVLQFIYLINTEIFFELITNNNFFQELLFKFFLVYWTFIKI